VTIDITQSAAALSFDHNSPRKKEMGLPALCELAWFSVPTIELFASLQFAFCFCYHSINNFVRDAERTNDVLVENTYFPGRRRSHSQFYRIV